jgi:hypothetical protein
MPAADEGPPVSRRTRRVLHLFLLVFAVTGVAHLELFPFSGFRLFSELRPAERQSWQLRAVDDAGQEIPIRLGDLPLGYRNTSIRLQGFDALNAAERDEVCDAWAEPLRDAGAEVVAVRVYAVVQGVRPDAPPPVRRLAYECGDAR